MASKDECFMKEFWSLSIVFTFLSSISDFCPKRRHKNKEIQFRFLLLLCREYCCGLLQKIQRLSWSLASKNALRSLCWFLFTSVRQNVLHLYCLQLLNWNIHNAIGLLSQETNDLLLASSLFQATIASSVLGNMCPAAFDQLERHRKPFKYCVLFI